MTQTKLIGTNPKAKMAILALRKLTIASLTLTNKIKRA
jgi:hypothetical protein